MRSTKKYITLSLITMIGCLIWQPGGLKATQILKLKPSIEVHGDIVRLSDLFPNAVEDRDKPLFKSPDLGRQGTVAIEHLIDAASRYGFTFDTPLNMKEITVSRPARTIKADRFETHLHKQLNKLIDTAPDQNLSFNFSSPLTNQMVPLHLSGQLKLLNFSYNKVNKKFHAEFAPKDALTNRFNRTINGTTSITYKRPILKRAIQVGEAITKSDLEYKNFSRFQLSKNSLKNTNNIIGKIATKALKAGNFIKVQDLEIARLIKKNELVTIIFRRSGLSLKTQGKAMADGSLNETIAVMNLQSKRMVNGVIKSAGIVMIQNTTIPPAFQKTAQLNQN